jgi:hypothetical protein
MCDSTGEADYAAGEAKTDDDMMQDGWTMPEEMAKALRGLPNKPTIEPKSLPPRPKDQR